jgi:hypothetical protein
VSKRKGNPGTESEANAPLGPEPEPPRDGVAGTTAETAPDAPHPRPRTHREQRFSDAVTVLEIAKAEEGGIRERPLPGDRSLSPPSPPEAHREWKRSLVRRSAYVLVVVVLTFIFVALLIDVFHVG